MLLSHVTNVPQPIVDQSEIVVLSGRRDSTAVAVLDSTILNTSEFPDCYEDVEFTQKRVAFKRSISLLLSLNLNNSR